MLSLSAPDSRLSSVPSLQGSPGQLYNSPDPDRQMLAGRQAQSWFQVCPLLPDDHWPPGAASSLGPWLLSALGQNGADRALGLPRKTSAEGLCSKDRRCKKKSIVLFRGPAVAPLKARTPGFSYVRCPDLWGTQTQCLSFPAREMGLRDLGWGGGVECVLLGCLVGVQE